MTDRTQPETPASGAERPTRLQVDVVSLAQVLYSGEAAFVSLPGTEGSLGVYPGHEPLLTRLREGFVEIEGMDHARTRVYVTGGFLEVMPHGVTVLADEAVRTEDLDAARARAATPAPGAFARELARPNYEAVHAELIDAVSLVRPKRD